MLVWQKLKKWENKLELLFFRGERKRLFALFAVDKRRVFMHIMCFVLGFCSPLLNTDYGLLFNEIVVVAVYFSFVARITCIKWFRKYMVCARLDDSWL